MMTTPYEKFKADGLKEIACQGKDNVLKEQTLKWLIDTAKHKYSYHFEWMGRPIIQYPQDMVAFQEIVWEVKPDLIIETGIAHGGSLIQSASMLTLLDYCDALEKGELLDPAKPKRKVLGLDIDIRPHNRAAIEAHPMANRIKMLQGSSVDKYIVKQVWDYAKDFKRILICLDSNHTHEHVLAELEAYAPLTSKGSYCIVWDTTIEDMPEDYYPDRPWSKNDNPKTAVREYMRKLAMGGTKAKDGGELRFETDKTVEHKILLTVAIDGFLKRV